MSIWVATLAGCTPVQHSTTATPKRIISFAPSITETLFALGLGNRVVGVTRYCTYPRQVQNLPQIGGYLDPNFEMILSLKPDLVFLLREHSSIASFLAKNGIAFRIIDDENFRDILRSFRTIGGLFGKTREADSLVQSIKAEIADTTAAASRPKILLCVDRDDPGTGAIAKVYIAGPKSFYDQLIKYGGGANASADSSFEYPSFSAEGIMRLAPDIIVDLTTSAAGALHDKVRDDWKALSMVPAVKNSLVFCPNGDYMTIPGPRIALILREIRRTVEEFRKEHRKR